MCGLQEPAGAVFINPAIYIYIYRFVELDYLVEDIYC